jgi:hypothetical protein
LYAAPFQRGSVGIVDFNNRANPDTATGKSVNTFYLFQRLDRAIQIGEQAGSLCGAGLAAIRLIENTARIYLSMNYLTLTMMLTGCCLTFNTWKPSTGFAYALASLLEGYAKGVRISACPMW